MAEYRVRVIVEGRGSDEFDKMGRGADRAERAVDRLKKTFDGLERVGRRMMLVGAGVVGGVTAMAVVGVKSAIAYEAAHRRLQTFLKTQERVKAAVAWAEGREFRGVPFDETQIMNTIASMENAGLAYKEWFDTIGNAAAAAAGEGEDASEKMNRLADAIGKIAAGNIQGFRALKTEFPAIMAKAGLAMEENSEGWAKMVENPKIALAKLKTFMDTEYAGAMKRSAESTKETWRAVKDTFEDLLWTAVTPALAKVKGRMQAFIAWAQTPEGMAYLETMAKRLERFFIALYTLLERLVTKLGPPLLRLVDWFSRLNPNLQMAILGFPLLGGAAMVTAGKIGNLALTIRLLTLGMKGLGLAGAVGALGIVKIAAAAAVLAAQMIAVGEAVAWVYRLIPGLERMHGPIGAYKGLYKWVTGQGPASEIFMAPEAQFTQEPGEGQTPMKTPMSPLSAGAQRWRGLMAGWAPTPAGGGAGGFDGLGGGGGGGAGAGGGGGGGGRGGGFTLYQTIERVIIEGVKNIDEASLRGALGKLATSEAGRVG